MRTRGSLLTLATIAALSFIVPSALAIPAASASITCGSTGTYDASSGSCSYLATGTDSFTVPPGWTQANFQVLGAQGGGEGGDSGTYMNGLYYGGYSGLGGEADATISVTPGEVLEINVGAAGTSSQFYPGSGGGASDIRVGACASTLSCSLAARAIVAGGGGGGGGSSVSVQPGNGGNGSGGNGLNGTEADPTGCQLGGGGGGTSSAGGAAGSGGSTGNPGAAGTLGAGGAGYNAGNYDGAGSGGGG
ncbi:MAG: hypothetical protein ABSE47_12915 [Acidimicrobiales bacterium]